MMISIPSLKSLPSFGKPFLSLVFAALFAFSGVGAAFAQVVNPSNGYVSISGYADPGPYLAGWRRVSVTRPDSSTFNALLFYPASSPGENALYQGSGAPYPAIAFGHGYLVYPSRYQSTLEHLATWGYIVIATESGMEFFSDDQAYANDMSATLTYLVNQNQTAGAWLYQQVNVQRMGMSGHSMGAGASLLAAAADGRVKAVANLAAAETNPSAIALMPALYIPFSLISGSEDSFTPVETNSQVFFDQGGSPRQLPILEGGSHCGFMDQYIIGCDTGSMDRATQLRLSRELLVSFFQLYLKADQGAWRRVWGPEAYADSQVSLQADPGVALQTPSPQASGWSGGVATYWLTLTNTGRQISSFHLLAEDSPWAISFTPDSSPLLNPGQSTLIQVTVTLPVTGVPQSTQVLLSARSDLDQVTRQFLQITTTVTPYQSHLPFISNQP